MTSSLKLLKFSINAKILLQNFAVWLNAETRLIRCRIKLKFFLNLEVAQIALSIFVSVFFIDKTYIARRDDSSALFILWDKQSVCDFDIGRFCGKLIQLSQLLRFLRSLVDKINFSSENSADN